MSKENFLNRLKYLPETTKQFGGLVLIILIILSSFFTLNIMFGGGEELVKKMAKELKLGLTDTSTKVILKIVSGAE